MMTHCQLIPHMSALTDYGFGVCFNYLMLAAAEHGIKSLVINLNFHKAYPIF